MGFYGATQSLNSRQKICYLLASRFLSIAGCNIASVCRFSECVWVCVIRFVG